MAQNVLHKNACVRVRGTLKHVCHKRQVVKLKLSFQHVYSSTVEMCSAWLLVCLTKTFHTLPSQCTHWTSPQVHTSTSIKLNGVKVTDERQPSIGTDLLTQSPLAHSPRKCWNLVSVATHHVLSHAREFRVLSKMPTS